MSNESESSSQLPSSPFSDDSFLWKNKSKPEIVTNESFEVEDVSEWNPAVSSRFANRVPKQVARTVITVNERKMIFERSGGFFKLMGHFRDLVLLMFTAMLISMAVGAVFFAGKITGAL